mmetsp:Transcript_95619/g.164919  ORF Transcript_95619/g.164919 Transcript_95619/m.164919 type:complete len:99 (-) Transcript_95619:102-398(-)
MVTTTIMHAVPKTVSTQHVVACFVGTNTNGLPMICPEILHPCFILSPQPTGSRSTCTTQQNSQLTRDNKQNQLLARSPISIWGALMSLGDLGDDVFMV